MKNKNNKLWIVLFVGFLLFGNIISNNQSNSRIESKNSIENENYGLGSNISEFSLEEKNFPKSQTIYINGSYLSRFDHEHCYALNIVNDTLFLGTGSNNGIYILNISKPENPVLLVHYSQINIDTFNKKFLIDNNTLYISEGWNGLRILNISDIYSITEISYFDGDVTDDVDYSIIYEGYMYIASNDCRLKIVDLADLTAETPSFNVLYESLGGRSQKLAIYNETIYIAEDLKQLEWIPRLIWYDLSDPINPVVISWFYDFKVWDFEFENDIMYISSTDGIHIYNISNPYNIFEISYMPFSISMESEIALSNGLLVAGCKQLDTYDMYNYDTYIMAYNVSDPYNPQFYWNLSTFSAQWLGHLTEIEIKDGLIYTSQINNGLVIYDSGIDTDEDGVSDCQERNIYHTDPLVRDTDNDGLIDGEEVYTYLTDPANNDTDSDLLADGDEISLYNTDPTTNDTDGDTLIDWDELFLFHLDPVDDDFDEDGLDDGTEMKEYISDKGLSG
ncbi:MAG: hypothetical protein ACTSUK_03750, partial [Promethearchaeota archaeon]